MDIYRQGQDITVSIESKNELTGESVEATAASYIVKDGDGTVLVSSTPVPGFVSGAPMAVVTVPAASNSLAAGVARAIRVIQVHFTVGSVDVVNRLRYAIERDDLLVVMNNSFQTYDNALLTAVEIPDLKVWSGKSDRERSVALISAYHNLARLCFKIPNAVSQSHLAYDPGDPFGTEYVPDIKDLSKDEFEALDARFREALCRAQIVEADVLMNGDPVAEYRRDGMISHTIGEVSQFWRSAKPLDLSVSERALRHLRGYVDWSMRVGRG